MPILGISEEEMFAKHINVYIKISCLIVKVVGFFFLLEMKEFPNTVILYMVSFLQYQDIIFKDILICKNKFHIY